MRFEDGSREERLRFPDDGVVLLGAGGDGTVPWYARARAEDLVGATFLEKWAGCGVFEGTVAGVEDADAPKPKVAVDWDDGMRTSMPLAKLRKILRREALKPTRRA